MSHPQPKLPTAAALIRQHSRAAYIAAGDQGRMRRDKKGFDRHLAVSLMVQKYA